MKREIRMGRQIILHTLRIKADGSAQLHTGKAEFAQIEDSSGGDLQEDSYLIGRPEPIVRQRGRGVVCALSSTKTHAPKFPQCGPDCRTLDGTIWCDEVLPAWTLSQRRETIFSFGLRSSPTVRHGP